MSMPSTMPVNSSPSNNAPYTPRGLSLSAMNNGCVVRPPPPPNMYCTPAAFTRQPGEAMYLPLSAAYGRSVPMRMG